IPDGILQALKETNDYYLLAWRPESQDERDGKSRIRVSIKNRPDLRVRLRRNYYVPPPAPKKEDKKSATPASGTEPAEAGLVAALGAVYARRELPTALSVGYLDTPDQGLVLKASMQLDRAALDLAAGESGKAELDVLGAAIDDRGIIVTFKQVLTVTPDPQNQQPMVVWNQQLRLKPGLYQVRVAVRERATGRTGSAQQWIEVPDLSGGRFQLSSLFLGERKMAAADEKFATAPRPVMVDVDHHFKRSSVLRFQAYVYNAGRAGAATPPDVEIQARVVRDNRTLLSTAPAKVPADTTKDLTRLPYWAEIPLEQLAPGRYSLQVTATDRRSKTVVSERASFIVE
ncbi:MAG TPA: hypothetical protein VJT09_02515, partial [Pyrinomonadaceae bacterium]|nr:hypothetical protein [Pyrinomonadaceae bacterium]